MKKNTLWIGVLASLVFFTLLVGYIVVATKINNAVDAVPTSTPPGSVQQTGKVNSSYEEVDVTITIDLPLSTSNKVQLFGSIIDPECVSPYNPKCLRDYSSHVSGGRLSANFKVPVGVRLYYGYVVDNEIYFESTTVNGVVLNRACYAADKTNSNSWYMVSFSVDRYPNGSYAVIPNLMCQENPKRMKLKIVEEGTAPKQ